MEEMMEYKAEVPLVWNRLKTIEMSQKKSYNKPIEKTKVTKERSQVMKLKMVGLGKWDLISPEYERPRG